MQIERLRLPDSEEQKPAVQTPESPGDALVGCGSSVFRSEDSQVVGTDHQVLRYVSVFSPSFDPPAFSSLSVVFQMVSGGFFARWVCSKAQRARTPRWWIA